MLVHVSRRRLAAPVWTFAREAGALRASSRRGVPPIEKPPPERPSAALDRLRSRCNWCNWKIAPLIRRDPLRGGHGPDECVACVACVECEGCSRGGCARPDGRTPAPTRVQPGFPVAARDPHMASHESLHAAAVARDGLWALAGCRPRRGEDDTAWSRPGSGVGSAAKRIGAGRLATALTGPDPAARLRRRPDVTTRSGTFSVSIVGVCIGVYYARA